MEQEVLCVHTVVKFPHSDLIRGGGGWAWLITTFDKKVVAISCLVANYTAALPSSSRGSRGLAARATPVDSRCLGAQDASQCARSSSTVSTAAYHNVRSG